MKNKPGVILQGHMDMVCEKNSDVEFDFSKDPIQLKIEGDFLTAVGTTLGADNGIGLAMSLAILEDDSLKHGPVEGLFTIDEETGLTGAFAMSGDFLKGKILLNLDSEDFGVLTVGCAGGGDSQIRLPFETQPVNGTMDSVLVKVSGLRGGHSGVDIHEQRGNAVKLLSRMLWKAKDSYKFNVSEIKGGDKHNAIPREAYAKIVVDKNDKDNTDHERAQSPTRKEIRGPPLSVQANVSQRTPVQVAAKEPGDGHHRAQVKTGLDYGPYPGRNDLRHDVVDHGQEEPDGRKGKDIGDDVQYRFQF